MRTAIYVDGFNLYHSALEARPAARWLDLHALGVQALHPQCSIVAIRYFTARVKGNENQGAPQRQDTYVRALCAHIPHLTVHWGNFTTRQKWALLVHKQEGVMPAPERAQIIKREEKGSDVNLAVHLLNDAWHNIYDCAVLISDDTDLCEPLRLVRQMGKKVVILSPVGLQKMQPGSLNAESRVTSAKLRECSDSVRYLTMVHLNRSQLPNPVINSKNGKPYTRPLTWT